MSAPLTAPYLGGGGDGGGEGGGGLQSMQMELGCQQNVRYEDCETTQHRS